jgi:hypothetical protein
MRQTLVPSVTAGARRALMLSFSLLAFSAIATDTASASTESFRRSCSEIRVSQVGGRRVITALCERSRRSDGAIQIGNEARLVVPAQGCEDISNNEGYLQCNGAELPRGSWSQSCRYGNYNGRVFHAACAPRGTTVAGVNTWIDMNTCPSFRLANIDGRLRCY